MEVFTYVGIQFAMAMISYTSMPPYGIYDRYEAFLIPNKLAFEVLDRYGMKITHIILGGQYPRNKSIFIAFGSVGLMSPFLLPM